MNECLVSNGDCAQVCRNLAGSYECDCRRGYLLNPDSRTCDGRSQCGSTDSNGQLTGSETDSHFISSQEADMCNGQNNGHGLV